MTFYTGGSYASNFAPNPNRIGIQKLTTNNKTKMQTHDELLRGLLGKNYDGVMALYKAMPKELKDMIMKHKDFIDDAQTAGLHPLLIIQIIENEQGVGYDYLMSKHKDMQGINNE